MGFNCLKVRAIILTNTSLLHTFLLFYSVHWGINFLLKNISFPLSCQTLLKSANCPSPLLFRQSHLYICFLWTPPPKNQIFQWNPKISKFFILNPILLTFKKVTKFLVDFFLSLKILVYFLCKNWNPHPLPCKSHPLESLPARSL